MASRLLLLPVPAPDGIVQRGALVVGKEVADILVVLELYLEVEALANMLLKKHRILLRFRLRQGRYR